MSDTILAVLISSGFNLIALIVMKLFDYKRARNERKFMFLKEFRAEKLKAYSILSEKIFNFLINEDFGTSICLRIFFYYISKKSSNQCPLIC